MNKDELEKLLIRFNRVTVNITKSVNFGNGSPTKAQELEQKRIIKKLSKELGLDCEYLLEEINK